MKHRHGRELFCPLCGEMHNGAINASGEDVAPSPGDCTLCGYCRGLLIYGGDPIDHLRRPTLDEETELLADPDVQRAIAALAELHRRHKLAGNPPEERGTTR